MAAEGEVRPRAGARGNARAPNHKITTNFNMNLGKVASVASERDESTKPQEDKTHVIERPKARAKCNDAFNLQHIHRGIMVSTMKLHVLLSCSEQ